MSQLQTSMPRISTSLSIVQNCLHTLVRSSQAGIESVYVISDQGLPILSSYKKNRAISDEDQLSAMIASIVVQVTSAMKRMGKKKANQLTIETANTYILISPITENLILVTICDKDTHKQSGTGLGLIYRLIKETQEKLQSVL